MLPLSSWTTSLVVIALSGVDARPVDTNITSIPTANNSSFQISDLTNVTAAAQSCTDIKQCRTMDQIVVSCLVTILACVWFAVHRNVPAPKPKPYRHGNVFMQTVRRARDLILDQRESAIVFVVALLAPEWILAWALRQAIAAWNLTEKLERAKLEAIKTQNKIYSMVSRLERDAEAVAGSSDGWGMSHAFLAVMGGFLFYDGHGPLRPLSPNDVVELVRRGHLVPPTAEEISNQSKGDALSKGVAIIQTLWFAMQCIVRHTEDLPVTSLEIMTLAYTVMTVAMYIAWWDIRKIPNMLLDYLCVLSDVDNRGTPDYHSIGERITNYVMGMQDRYVDLSKCKRVPTFWAGTIKFDGKPFKYDDRTFGETPKLDGKTDGKTIITDLNIATVATIADKIALFVAMVFGAVHCMAWYSEFQTHLELQLWRSSAITIIAVPVAFAVGYIVAVMIDDHVDFDIFLLIGALYTPIAIIYVAARLILIILSFTSLRALPAGAYQTIQWTTYIPHI
ncbi:hypothetical protein FIBSPDRAFT_763657 [Athelia psychrophila]|uniref:Transmembrane protein n=1 Tax=Athelia psychrophila TaxID=1759441 RepID=A0A167X6H1_9AGAM|nr:hypothetical protein FIBSPDRAFT_763657 [Fibularhizoctonia sp. CBS 109695]